MSRVSEYISNGKQLFQEGNYKVALEFFQAAIAEDSQSDKAYLGLAQVYNNLGKDAESLKALHLCLAINPDNQDANTLLQSLYLRQATSASSFNTNPPASIKSKWKKFNAISSAIKQHLPSQSSQPQTTPVCSAPKRNSSTPSQANQNQTNDNTNVIFAIVLESILCLACLDLCIYTGTEELFGLLTLSIITGLFSLYCIFYNIRKLRIYYLTKKSKK